MKVMRRKITNGKQEKFKLKDKMGNISSNRGELINIVEEFYQTFYTSLHKK